MAVLIDEDFEGGSNGAAISTSNSTVDAVIRVFNFSNTHAHSGTLAGNPNYSSNNGYISWENLAANPFYLRFYVYMTANPAASTYLLSCLQTSGAKITDLRVNTDGTVSARDLNTVKATTTTALTLNAWNRIEYRVDNTAAKQQIRVFVGANVDGSTADEETSISGSNGNYTQGLAVDEIHLGVITSVTFAYWVDDVAANNTSWVGPAASPAQDYTETPSDSAGFTDSITISKAIPISKTDQVNFADAVLLDRVRVPIDGTGVVDSVVIARSQVRTDTVGPSDLVIIDRDVHADTDDVGITDDVTPVLARIVDRSEDDAVGITDGVALAHSVSATDSTGIADTASKVSAIVRSFTNSAGFTDSASNDVGGATNWTQSKTDAVGITDGGTEHGLAGVLTEAVGITDSVTVVKGAFIVTDPVGITDGNATRGLAGELTETLGITDQVGISKVVTNAHIITVTDDMGIGEYGQTARNWEVLEEEDVFSEESIEVARQAGPATGIVDPVGITDEVIVEHDIAVGFNYTLEIVDSVGFIDEPTVTHVEVNDYTVDVVDPVGFSDTLELFGGGGQDFVSAIDLAKITDSVTVTKVTVTIRVRLVLDRAIEGPRLDDWFWRHARWIPQPTQVALLVYPDGTVLETDNLMSEQARTAPFVAGGGHETILESTSWQAQVLADAGYELEPVT